MKRAIEFEGTVTIRSRVVVDATEEEIDAICNYYMADSFDEILEYIETGTNAKILSAEEDYFVDTPEDFEYFDDYWRDQEEQYFGDD